MIGMLLRIGSLAASVCEQMEIIFDLLLKPQIIGLEAYG